MQGLDSSTPLSRPLVYPFTIIKEMLTSEIEACGKSVYEMLLVTEWSKCAPLVFNTLCRESKPSKGRTQPNNILNTDYGGL
jgi:hypothetical protein